MWPASLLVPTLPDLSHTIVHTIVRLLFTYVTIIRLVVLVLYHTLVDSTLELSQI
jgi:hypothetical protein